MFARVPIHVRNLHRDLSLERAINARLVAELQSARAAMVTASHGIEATVTRYKSEVAMLDDPESKSPVPVDDTMLESESALKLLKQLENLYEVQRERLENEVDALTTQTDDWVDLAEKLTQQLGDDSNVSVTHCYRPVFVGDFLF